MMFIYHLIQKLQERASIFQKSDLPPKTKEKWRKVLVADAMPCHVKRGEVQRQMMLVRPLPWCSDLVKFFPNWVTWAWAWAWAWACKRLWGSARSVCVCSLSMCPHAPLPMKYPDGQWRLKTNMLTVKTTCIITLLLWIHWFKCIFGNLS